jgi:transposase
MSFAAISRLHWLHVLSNDEWTLYRVAEKRGDIPTELSGIVVHDHFKPYYRLYNVLHALCGAHHLRELKGLSEIEKEPWTQKMSRLLKLACHKVNQGPVSTANVARIDRLYDSLVKKGLAFHEQQTPLTQAKRGRQKRRLGHNLLIRLRDYKEDTLRFLTNQNVPFTNNQAELDIRMIKVKQKISGGFRTMSGAEMFAATRSFFSTLRKQGIQIFQATMAPFGCSSYFSV